MSTKSTTKIRFCTQEKYILSKQDERNIRYSEQIDLFDNLFKSKRKLTINGAYNSSVKKALNAHKRSLQNQFRDFLNQGNNAQFNIVPFLWIILTTAIIAITYVYEPYTEIAKLPIIIIYPVLSIIGLAIYAYLIKKPTIEKVELKERIKSLRDYLSWTEKDYVEGYDISMRDIEHFESLLPYAHALGVADKWQSSFEHMIKDSLQFKNHYWLYNSPYFYNHFSRSVSTSAVPPSSSSGGSGFSGGGGGGFSGGGGGGGGVGGW